MLFNGAPENSSHRIAHATFQLRFHSGCNNRLQSYLLYMSAPASVAKQGRRGASPRFERNQPICRQIAGRASFTKRGFASRTKQAVRVSFLSCSFF
jgi:hypothetical protein